MTRIEVYDADYETLDKFADANDTSISEVVACLIEQFIDEVEV